MTIQKLNSVAFGSSMKQNFGENSLYKLSDEQIKQIALAEPSRRLQSVKKNSVYTLMVGLPLVDSFLSAAMTDGSLAKKSAKFLAQQSRWLGVFAVGSALFGAKHFINKKSEILDNFNKKHPVLATGVDFAALYGSIVGVGVAASSMLKVINNKFPKLTVVFNKNISNKFSKVLDNSVLNKKYVNKFNNYLAKNSYAKKAGTFFAVTAAPVIAIATILRCSKEANFAASRANNNYILLNLFNRFLPEKPILDDDTQAGV